jgi:hypothetical protein
MYFGPNTNCTHNAQSSWSARACVVNKMAAAPERSTHWNEDPADEEWECQELLDSDHGHSGWAGQHGDGCSVYGSQVEAPLA